MKILIALLFSLLLTACSASPAQEEQVLPEASAEQELSLEQPVPPQEQAIRYEADTTLFADTLYAEDGTQLLHYAVHIPYLSAWREDGTEITEARNEPEERHLPPCRHSTTALRSGIRRRLSVRRRMPF